MVKLPSQMATWLSPKGRVKKHNLYSKQPSAWRRQSHARPVAPTRNKDRGEEINQEQSTPSHTTNLFTPLDTSWFKVKNYVFSHITEELYKHNNFFTNKPSLNFIYLLLLVHFLLTMSSYIKLWVISLTQISAFVVIILLLQRFTISGARYDKVVYLKENRETFRRTEQNRT